MDASVARPNHAASGFRLTPEQEEILEQASRFGEKELWPLQARMDDEEW